MSAPTPAPGDDRPREGYYPDPSIPGYVRYWNGTAWVPGSSRPAPSDGEPLAPPPGARHAPASVEATGPHFFDEDPEPAADSRRVSPAEAQHGSRPEPASAWGAERARQTGFGGDPDRRVSWGAPQGADPRVPRAADPADAAPRPDGRAGHPDGTARTDGTATIPPADADGSGSAQPPASAGTVVFRRPGHGDGDAGPRDTSGHQGPGPAEGTMTFRARSPRTGEQDGSTPPAAPEQPFAAPAPSAQAAARQALGLDPETPAAGPQQAGPPPQRAASAPRPGGPQPSAPQPPSPQPSLPPQQAGSHSQQPAGSLSPQPSPTVPPQSGAGAFSAMPMTSGDGGGQPSWAQQVHRLAGPEGEQPVAPWKPPVEDIFQAAARAHAAARPAGLGKRLAARLVDTLVLAAVTGVAAVPLGTKAIDHINDKVDAAKLSGETVTVWLLDGTTALYLGIVLAVLLLFGVLYEALPTAKWGRTLGKKLCGLEVRDIEGHEPPSFGLALRRWLVYSVPGLLGIGVVGVLWCLFDRPWRQCWHDKAAHTFVAG
ncbi:RDD family protein [Streptomyces avermitilis]